MSRSASKNVRTGEDAVRAHFRRQADACQTMSSPFTAALCRLLPDVLDHRTDVGRTVLSWPNSIDGDALALRLCGALHRLVLTGVDQTLAAVYPPHDVDETALRPAVRQAVTCFAWEILSSLDSPPQTNEVARSAMLYPGFLAIARHFALPLAIREIGASAGLNLLADRFRYRYGGRDAGHSRSPVLLQPEVREGVLPDLDGDLTIVSRSGCDIAPVDIRDAAQRLRLRSFIWADQDERLRRLDGAIEMVLAAGIAVHRASAADFVQHSLENREPGAALVIFHSIMWQYMPAPERDRIEAMLTGAGTDAALPLAWLRMEPAGPREPHALLTLTLWPGGVTRSLARCDYHGRWIEALEHERP